MKVLICGFSGTPERGAEESKRPSCLAFGEQREQVPIRNGITCFLTVHIAREIFQSLAFSSKVTNKRDNFLNLLN